MKKTILMGILIGIIGFSSANESVNKAGLLSHLKSIRSEMSPWQYRGGS